MILSKCILRLFIDHYEVYNDHYIMWSVANDLKLYYKMCIIWNINPKTHPT